MPVKPKRPCRRASCTTLTTDGFCDKHTKSFNRGSRKESDRDYYEKRTDVKEHRFYNSSAWVRLRKIKLHRNPLCEQCDHMGDLAPAEIVDHIIEVKDDWRQRLKYENLQSLCWGCHNRKTTIARKRRKRREGMTKVTVVCGPPGAGKTTYVKERAQPGDLIIDLDWIWRALSGLPYLNKPDELKPFVFAVREALYSKLEEQSKLERAWIVAGAPEANTREELGHRFHADVLLLPVKQEVSEERIKNDSTRPNSVDKIKPWIEDWWKRYTPSDLDSIIKSEGH